LTRFSTIDSLSEVQTSRLTELRTQWGLSNFERILLVIGRIASEKSVLEMLLVLAPWLKQHPEACMLFVGDGPQRRELERLLPTLGIADQVVFTGEQPWESVPDYYRLADVLLGNSTSETQGLTFIEAIASGTPVIARNNDCFKGILTDGSSATLLQNEEGFVPALDALLGDESFYTTRVAGGLEAAQLISKDVFVDHVLQTYHQARS